jgi:hypothetical protein
MLILELFENKTLEFHLSIMCSLIKLQKLYTIKAGNCIRGCLDFS